MTSKSHKKHAHLTRPKGGLFGQHEYAFIGAGTVVTKEVKPFALMVGNPARQLGWMSAYGTRLEFDENGNATCKESGEKYKLTENTVKKLND